MNIDRVIAMLLVHDIGEIDAGDTMVFVEGGWEQRKAAELASVTRIFGLLPQGRTGNSSPSGRSSKRPLTPEARFAHSVDRAMPVLLNLTTMARAGARTASATSA